MIQKLILKTDSLIQKTDSNNSKKWFQWFQTLILMIQKTDFNNSKNWFHWFQKLISKTDSHHTKNCFQRLIQKLIQKKCLQIWLAMQKLIPKTDYKNCLQILIASIAWKHCLQCKNCFAKFLQMTLAVIYVSKLIKETNSDAFMARKLPDLAIKPLSNVWLIKNDKGRQKI